MEWVTTTGKSVEEATDLALDQLGIDVDEAEIEASRAPLMDHLIELRGRLLICVVAFFLAFILCFAFANQIQIALIKPYQAAVAIHARLAEAGIPYVDAPVSGMVEGAREGTLSVMYSGPKAALERLRPVFMAMGRNVFDMGEKPGQGQAMKVLNNYLALLSLFATSEALTFGRAMDLDLKQMVDVLNVSSGRNIASMAMFPAWVLTGTMRGGFPAKGVVKDIGGFMEGARSLDTPRAIAEALEATVGRFNDAGPDTDMAHAWTWTLAQAKGAVT